jgi:membrane protein
LPAYSRDPDVRSRLRRRLVEVGSTQIKLNPIDRFRKFFGSTIWDDQRASTRFKRFLYTKLRVVTLAFRNFQAHGLPTHAASLTYASILAIVPVLVVGLSIFTAFGGLEDTKNRVMAKVLENLAPNPEQAKQIDTTLREWMENLVRTRTHPDDGMQGPVSPGAGTNPTAAFAVVILLFTVIRTLSNLEETFNQIVGVVRGRSWLQRITVYWAVLTVGPLLMGASLAMTGMVESTSFVTWLKEHAGPIVEAFYRYSPILLTCTAFAGLYMFLPAGQVKPKAALVGGIVAGLAFEIAKRLFAVISAKLIASYAAVYGTVATLFVFLIWMNICWMIVLIGLELVVAVQSATTHRKEELATRVSPKVREMIGLRLVTEICEAFYDGKPAPVLEKLATALDLPERLIVDVLVVLENQGLIRSVDEGNDQYSYVPAKMLDHLTVGDVLKGLRSDGEEGLCVREDDETRYLSAVLERTDAACQKIYKEESFKEIVSRIARGDVPPGKAENDAICDVKPAGEVEGKAAPQAT